ncbi:MAG: carboxy-S-adenosyl-L-methionine synthase CmoA [Gammaproteobacteria bacterium]
MSVTSKQHTTDDVYREPLPHVVDFAFDEAVAGVFPDMVRRSVPGYETVIALSGLIAARHVRPGSRVYDLGCSLGATTLALLARIGNTDCEILAVDNSAAMLERARAGRQWDPRVTFVLEDVCNIDIRDASVVLANYVVQFVPPAGRTGLLSRIHSGLRPGGALILSEKLAGDEEFDTVHEDFKRANGYSELEVSQKRSALENVMVPDTLEAHVERLERAGFAQVSTWFRCLNWASLIAIA